MSIPTAPVLLGSTFGFATNIVADGTTLYFVQGQELTILDVSDPTTPVLLGSYPTGQFTDVEDIAVVDSTAYLSIGSSGVQIVDVSNPASPALLGTFATTQLSWSLTVISDTLYIGTDDLEIVDVSNPAAPTQIGSFDAAGSVLDVVVDGTTDDQTTKTAHGRRFPWASHMIQEVCFSGSGSRDRRKEWCSLPLSGAAGRGEQATSPTRRPWSSNRACGTRCYNKQTWVTMMAPCAKAPWLVVRPEIAYPCVRVHAAIWGKATHPT